MATAFLLAGLLWLYLAIAPFFTAGADRRQMREGLRDFWKQSTNYVFPLNHVVRALFFGVYVLWLFPATRPGWGVAGGFCMLLLSAALT